MKQSLGNHPNIGDEVGHHLDIDRYGHTTRWLILLPPLVLYVNVSRNNTLIFVEYWKTVVRSTINNRTLRWYHQVVSLRNLYRGKEKETNSRHRTY